MTRSVFMRIVLVVSSVLILIGVALMTWMLVTKQSRNNIRVSLFDGEPAVIEFEALSLVPGEQCEYNVRLKTDFARTCDLHFDFVELEEKTLKNFARVKIIAKGEVLYDELLATAFTNENIVLPIDFNENKNTELQIVYYLPIEVGNEAKNAQAVFELRLAASNE